MPKDKSNAKTYSVSIVKESFPMKAELLRNVYPVEIAYLGNHMAARGQFTSRLSLLLSLKPALLSE